MTMKTAEKGHLYLVGLTASVTGLLLMPVEFALKYGSGRLDVFTALSSAFRSGALTALTVAALSLPVYFLVRTLDRFKPGLMNRPMNQSLFISGGVFTLLLLDIFSRMYSKAQAMIIVLVIGGSVTIVSIAVFYVALKSGRRSERLEAKGIKLAWIGMAGIAVFFGLSYILPVQEGWIHDRASRSDGPDRPNIILVVWDTVRADHLSLYGYHSETTPFLDAFASDSVVFEKAYAASPWTLPSHASLFTGLYPSQHGAHAEHMVLDASFRTAAEIFQDNGYQTVCFSNNAYISDYHNMLQGFEDIWFKGQWAEEIERKSSGLEKRVHSFYSWIWNSLNLQFFARFMKNPASLWDNPDASTTTEAASEWLEKGREGDKPFFLFINYMDAHLPYNPKEEYAKNFLDGDQLEASYRKDLRYPPFKYFLDLSLSPYSDSDIAIINGLYDGCLRSLDDALEELVTRVEDLGYGEDTMIIITSDHGEYLGERDRLAHGLGLHDELLHVPLLIRYPVLFEPGTQNEQAVTHVDIFETMLGVAGIAERPEGMPEVRSLSNLDDKYRAVFGEFRFPLHVLTSASLMDDNTNLFVEQKTIHTNEKQFIWKSRGEFEYYNVIEDPLEVNNLYSEDNEEAEEMYLQLMNWFDSLYIPRPRLDSKNLSSDESLELKERLRALGYIK
jgi:arylsulfatase A-like enzyme